MRWLRLAPRPAKAGQPGHTAHGQGSVASTSFCQALILRLRALMKSLLRRKQRMYSFSSLGTASYALKLPSGWKLSIVLPSLFKRF